MPQMQGMELKKVLRPEIATIICTAYPQYAIEGFEQEVQDYLMKPVSLERFQKAIQKCRLHVLGSTDPADSRSNKNYIFIRSEHKMIRILFHEILYFQGLRDYVAIHTKDKKILTLQSMRSIESELPASTFMRIHKSYIVNISAIDSLHSNRLFINGNELPISESFKKYVHENINKK
jgi:DNA-binding LytR/AlgR family response regulator